ncbi:hypothetical protein DPMN_097212 [Dreissena polymorpha]|uniref:Uncharacterized protein n=1 Tax=Dreissena polymorpha TaxID=45954 RepID=A0A9D4LCU8_DREPO|nr:hypothetical protein DPMN_097212 [Dreissena polymorpha]
MGYLPKKLKKSPEGAYARSTSTSSVAAVRFLCCVASSQKEKSGRECSAGAQLTKQAHAS